MYAYNATVVEVRDGDSIKVDIDLGFNLDYRTIIRLAGCNARELGHPGGIEARDNLRGILAPGDEVILHTIKPDKFQGRYDADVYFDDRTSGANLDLVKLLLDGNWVALWDGQGQRPLPPWPRP